MQKKYYNTPLKNQIFFYKIFLKKNPKSISHLIILTMYNLTYFHPKIFNSEFYIHFIFNYLNRSNIVNSRLVSCRQV